MSIFDCGSKLVRSLIVVGSLGGVAMATAAPTPAKDVGTVLDRFHGAAAQADGKTYFDLFAPEGVFLGTDATERWTVDEFKAYAMPFFARGKGWSYTPRNRHVDLAPSGDVAWFDELLDNSSYGECRGSGVLRKIGTSWKIVQYHLTIPVPNALADKVVEMIRGAGAKPAPKK